MLRQRSFWVLTAIFTVFFVTVIIISINMYKHNEDKLMEHAIRAHTELAKYLTVAIRENDSEELNSELDHNHLNLVCLSQNCEVPDGFSLVQKTNNKNDLIELYSSSDMRVGLRITTDGHQAFLITKDHETPKHFKVVALLGGLSILMFSLYVLAIVNLAKTRKIEELLMQKDEFLSTVSHEIKTPLAKAKLALQFVPDSDKKTVALDAIRRIDTLSTVLLNNQRVQNSDVKTVFASYLVFEASKIVMQNENIQIAIESDFEIKCSSVDVITAIKNLMENGINHSSDGKCVVVVNNGYIEVSNSVNKPVLPLEDLTKPFSKDEMSKGFGFGLYLVQNIATKNGLKLIKKQFDDVVKFALYK